MDSSCFSEHNFTFRGVVIKLHFLTVITNTLIIVIITADIIRRIFFFIAFLYIFIFTYIIIVNEMRNRTLVGMYIVKSYDINDSRT